MALKLSGMAAKNFALFVYAVLKDQKKIHGKTRLVRMLKEQRPFKFFNVPTENMKEFAKEAKVHGLLYVPIRNKKKADRIEVVVFADDASKIQRIFDNLGLDAVKAQAGEATIEKVQEQEKQAPTAPGKTETVKTEQGEVEFEVGGFEDDFNIDPAQQDAAANFTSGREKEAGEPAEKSPSAPSSPSKSSSPGLTGHREPEQKPSVKKQLQEIRQEQAEKKAEKSKQQERQHPTPGHAKQKKKKKQKGQVMQYRFIQFHRKETGTAAPAGTAPAVQGRIRRHEAG